MQRNNKEVGRMARGSASRMRKGSDKRERCRALRRLELLETNFSRMVRILERMDSQLSEFGRRLVWLEKKSKEFEGLLLLSEGDGYKWRC